MKLVNFLFQTNNLYSYKKIFITTVDFIVVYDAEQY